MSEDTKTKPSKAFETTDLAEFNRYLKSPWRIMWNNFIGGVFKGFGIVVGATVVVAIAAWFVTALASSSFISKFDQLKQYVSELESVFNEYAQENNYKEDFEQITLQLQDLNKNLNRTNQALPSNFPPEIIDPTFRKQLAN